MTTDQSPDNSPLTEIVQSLLFTAAAEIPIVSAAAGHLERRLQDSVNRGMEKGLRFLELRLERLEGRASREFVSKEELDELLTGWMATVRRSQREDKMRAAAHLVANQLLAAHDDERLTPAEADLFMRAIEQLPRDAIAVLFESYQLAKSERRADLSRESVRLQFTSLCSRFKGTDPHLLVGILGELDRFGLLYRESRPAVRLGSYEDQPFDFTPLGFRFIERLIVDA